MIFKPALKTLTAIVVLATAAGIAVVAAAFALFAFLCEYLSPAGAAATIAGVAALTALIAGLLLKPRAAKRLADAPSQDDMLGRVIELARKRPILAATATIAVGVFAVRNPKLLGALVSALIAKEAVTPSKR